MPELMERLGLPEAELSRHIALDIGVSAMGARLAELLDAPFVEQRYSRLVIDCNRALRSDGSVALESDGTFVPGNAGLSDEDRAAREDAIFTPYHRAIGECLAARDVKSDGIALVSLHSFTPAMAGVPRPWQVGVLHGGGDERFALTVLSALRAEPGLEVGDNEPYRMDETDYTVPVHAFGASRPYVEIEVRQDELATAEGVARMSVILCKALRMAAEACLASLP